MGPLEYRQFLSTVSIEGKDTGSIAIGRLNTRS